MQIIGLDRRIDEVKLGGEQQMLDFRCRLDTQLILRAARNNRLLSIERGFDLFGRFCMFNA